MVTKLVHGGLGTQKAVDNVNNVIAEHITDRRT